MVTWPRKVTTGFQVGITCFQRTLTEILICSYWPPVIAMMLRQLVTNCSSRMLKQQLTIRSSNPMPSYDGNLLSLLRHCLVWPLVKNVCLVFSLAVLNHLHLLPSSIAICVSGRTLNQLELSNSSRTHLNMKYCSKCAFMILKAQQKILKKFWSLKQFKFGISRHCFSVFYWTINYL